MQHMEAALVGGIPGTFDLHPRRMGAHRHLAAGLAAPRAAPTLHLQQFERRCIDEQLDRILITQPVAAGYGIVKVIVQAVVVLDHASSAALGGHRVTAHGVDLREQAQAHGEGSARQRNGRTQTGSSGPDDGDVRRDVHKRFAPALRLTTRTAAGAPRSDERPTYPAEK